MKIVHLVLGKANPERLNGINRIVHNLALAMHRQGLDVEVWGITPDPEAETPAREYRLRLFAARRNRFAVDPELHGAVRELARAPRSTVFHLHGALLPQFHAVCGALSKHGIPYVVTPHGSYAEVALRRNALAKACYIALFDRRVLRGARAVQVNTEREARELRARVSGVNAVVVPNGQSLEEVEFEFRPLERPERPLFGFCGRLDSEHKGLDLLLDGFGEYHEDGGTGSLWLIGDDPERGELEARAADRNLDDVVEFLGPLFGEEKCNRLAHLDAFLHPSRHEGMPMSVLEAAALSLPLLVSRGTNLAEAVARHDAGRVIEPNTPAEIARVLNEAEELMCADELTDLGRNARRMIEQEFSWDRVARRIVAEAYGEPSRAVQEAA